MRRTFLLLIVMLLCPFCATAAPPEPAELATISQMDERFLPEEYDYWGVSFQYSGCGPATIVNALVASWGVTDADAAAALTRDVIDLTTYRSADDTIIFENLALLNNLGSLHGLPMLKQLLSDWGGFIRFVDGSLTLEDVRQAELNVSDAPCLLIGSVALETRWDFILNSIRDLYAAGHEDASICLAMAAAGTNNTPAPFASGEAGHYICLCFPVKEFWETGTFYIFDSMPRALDGETFGEYDPSAQYQRAYLFNRYSTLSWKLTDFLNVCKVERVTATVLCIRPTAPPTENDPPADEQAALQTYAAYLETLSLFNGGKAFIHIPQHN